jgi:hypothetical protein
MQVTIQEVIGAGPVKPIDFKDKNMKYPPLGYDYVRDIEAAIMIVGQRGSGKTSTIFKLLQNILAKHSKIFLYCNTAGQDNSWKYMSNWAHDNGHIMVENRSIYEKDPAKRSAYINLVEVMMKAMQKQYDKESGEEGKKLDSDDGTGSDESDHEVDADTVVQRDDPNLDAAAQYLGMQSNAPVKVKHNKKQVTFNEPSVDPSLDSINAFWGAGTGNDIDVDPKLNEIASAWGSPGVNLQQQVQTELKLQNLQEDNVDIDAEKKPTKSRRRKRSKPYKYKVEVVEGKKYRTVPYLVIFDDLPTELGDATIMDWVKQSRHFHSKTILSSQSYVDINKKTRGNVQLLILFAGLDDKLPQIHQEQNMPISFDFFRKLYHYCTRDKYNFMYCDSANKDFRKNFTQRFKL